MRILVATPLSTDESGGPARHLQMMLDELPKHGIKITTVSFKDFRKERKGLGHYKFYKELKKKAKHADLIYALDASSVGFPAALAARASKRRLITRVPGIHAWEQGVQQCGLTENLDEFVQKEDGYPWKVKVWLWMMRFVLDRSLKIVVPSGYLKKILVSLGADERRVQVVYSSFESQFDDSIVNTNREGNFIVSIGRIVPWKGFKSLVEIMPQIRSRVPDAKLVIIGDGPEKETLAAHARAIGLGDSVTFTGELSQENVRIYLAKAKVFALNTGYEGFSHTLLEAIDAGIPVVTTNVGGNPELVQDGVNGTLVDHEDRAALEGAIVELLQQPEIAGRYAASGKEHIKRFDKEHAGKSIADVLKQRLVLMISTDRKIFEGGSEVRERMKDYGPMAEELHIIVYSSHKHGCPESDCFGENVCAYSTGSENRWWYVWDAYKFGRTFKDIDLVTAQDPFETGLAGYFLARKFGAKLSLQVHTDITTSSFENHNRLNWIRMRIARFLLKRANCVRVVSNRIADWLQYEMLFPNPVVLPVYANVQELYDAHTPLTFRLEKIFPHITGPKVLWVGRLEDEKDCGTALRAFKEFLKQHPDAGLLILGEGRQEMELKIQARILGVAERIEWLGFQNELHRYYHTADLLLATSKYEGYGRMLVEAAAYNLPIVTTDVGVVGWWFNDQQHAGVCPVEDAACLAQKMHVIVEDPEEAKEMSARAREQLDRVHIPTRDDYLRQMRDTFENCGMHK